MEQFLIYLLKSSGITALFLLFYMLLLKRETFFRANRIYLLAGLGLSIFLPFLVITKTIWLQPTPVDPVDIENFAMSPLTKDSTIDWLSLLFYGYIAGVFVFMVRFAFQLLSLHRLISRSSRFEDGKFIRVETDKNISPFSFFRYIVYNPNLHSPSVLRTILVHERIHVKRKHSLDIMVMHLFAIFQWCNPFIWWYRASMDNNLEYLADTETIAQNTNKTEYQYLLLRTGIGERHYSLVTPFFNSSIKKRINMLNKNRSNRKNVYKYSFILPLLAGFILLFNVKTEAQVKSMESVQENADKYGPVVYDKERNADFPNLPLSIRKQASFYIGDSVPLYIVDGKEISKNEMDKIDPKEIASMNVWKGPQAIEKYGDKGKDGVIEITLKKNNLKLPDNNHGDSRKAASTSIKIHDSIDVIQTVTGEAPRVKLRPEKEYPLIILDGKETSKKNFEKIKPEDIESINVLKNQKATDKYGGKAKDGVIEVRTKGNSEHSGEAKAQSPWKVGAGLNKSDPNWNLLEYYGQMEKMAPSENYFPDIDKALILINGQVSAKKDLERISVNQIKMFIPISADNKEAIKKYGNQAKNGVIEIVLKKE